MTAQRLLQQAELPPAQPAYIFRGHKAQIHSLLFLRDNSRLASGDTDGFVVIWDVAIKRPKAVWKAHSGGILGLAIWSTDKIISHGRDGRLNVWQLRESDESGLSVELPVDSIPSSCWKDPWLLHSLQVHTLNFCAFAICRKLNSEEVHIATPSATEGVSVIHDLPSEQPQYLVPPAKSGKTGMVMALRMVYIEETLHVITGYESGLTSVQRLVAGGTPKWETIASCQPHTQPILSLDLLLDRGIYFTSGIDAMIAMASLVPLIGSEPLKSVSTKHSGQQSLVVRSDGKIFATAGWDGKMRVYSTKSLKEVAVLKWHKEGCYTVAFADIHAPDSGTSPVDTGNASQAAESEETVQKSQVLTVRKRRENLARQTHWLAAGSKDGKISLWDIF